MAANIEIQINPSFYKKLAHSAVKEAESQVIKDTTLEAESRCKKQSPGPGNQLPNTDYKASGNLRRGHSSEISAEEGLVKNNMNYWVYVVHGTSKMPARNYPQKVANELSSEHYMSNAMKKALKQKGVIE
ncbi:MAG: hypothetical protein IJ104_02310 [Methanobrevibacter sp.]|nr:hypothetical protein [Methanobrevibacter sp.]